MLTETHAHAAIRDLGVEEVQNLLQKTRFKKPMLTETHRGAAIMKPAAG